MGDGYRFERRVGPRRPRMILAPVAALLLAVVVIAAGCGGDAATDGESAGAAPEENLRLTVTIGQHSTQYSDIFLADELGFFDEMGVDVEIENHGTQLVSVFLSERADLIQAGPSALFPAAAEDKDVKVVWGNTVGNPYGFIVAADAPVEGPMDLSGATVASFGVGTSVGLPKSLSDLIVERGGDPLDIQVATDPTGTHADMVSTGAMDTTISARDAIFAYIEEGRLKYVPELEPYSPLMLELVPENLVGTSLSVLAGTIEEKREALVRFVAALRMVNQWQLEQDDEAIAETLHAVEGFGPPRTLEEIEVGVSSNRPIWNLEEEGHVSEEAWAASVDEWANWGHDVDFDSPVVTYQNRVDMTLWDEATELLQ